jgi:hypothetical protein
MPQLAHRNIGVSTPGARTGDGETTRNRALCYTASQIDTAQYIADMVLELRNMAKGAALYATMVPLEYAYYEAFSVANRVDAPREEIERLNHLGEDARRSEEAEGAA